MQHLRPIHTRRDATRRDTTRQIFNFTFYMDAVQTVACLLMRRRSKKKCKRAWIHPINQGRIHLGEYERLVQELRLDSRRFFQYFRMEPNVFDQLLCIVGPALQRKNTNYRDALSPAHRLAITLR